MRKTLSKPPKIQDLYPDLSPEQQKEAEYRLKAYVALCWRIYKRLESEGRLDEIERIRLRDDWEKRHKNIDG